MKKITIFIIFFLLFSINVKASYVIFNQDNGEVLLSSNMHEKRLIASITKVMTAHVVLNYANLDDVIEVGDEINEAHGSAIYLVKGERLSVRDLLYGMMLRSGNDAAIVLANYVGGSVENFVKLMNDEAENLGMVNTLFNNPTGLDDTTDGNISTAYDMALITKKAMENKTFRKIFRTKKYTCKSNKKSFSWTNKNKALFMSKYVTGGKTGYTKKAKRTLITTASHSNINLVIVSLNMSDDFNFHVNNYTNIFKRYKRYLIINKSNPNVDDTYYKKSGKCNFYLKDNYYIYSENRIDKINIKYILYKEKKVPSSGIIGKAQVYDGNLLKYEEPLYIRCLKKEVYI